MTSERDIDRLLDHWFNERPTQVADRVIDDVAARIVRQPQRPAWRLRTWRSPTMSTPIKLVAVGAALLIVVLGGAVFIGGGAGPAVPAPTASPSPSPVSSASPSASAVAEFPQWYPAEPFSLSGGAGILSPGSHATVAFSPGFTFSVPPDWVNTYDEAAYFSLFPDTPANQAEFARSEAMAHFVYMGPHDNPWFICDAIENNRGATAAEMVAALVTTEGIETSEPVDVTIGGLAGKQFDVQLDPARTDSCPPDPENPTKDVADIRVRGILLDKPDGGVIVIFLESSISAGHEAFLAEAMPIIESFEFDLSN